MANFQPRSVPENDILDHILHGNTSPQTIESMLSALASRNAVQTVLSPHHTAVGSAFTTPDQASRTLSLAYAAEFLSLWSYDLEKAFNEETAAQTKWGLAGEVSKKTKKEYNSLFADVKIPFNTLHALAKLLIAGKPFRPIVDAGVLHPQEMRDAIFPDGVSYFATIRPGSIDSFKDIRILRDSQVIKFLCETQVSPEEKMGYAKQAYGRAEQWQPTGARILFVEDTDQPLVNRTGVDDLMSAATGNGHALDINGNMLRLRAQLDAFTAKTIGKSLPSNPLEYAKALRFAISQMKATGPDVEMMTRGSPTEILSNGGIPMVSFANLRAYDEKTAQRAATFGSVSLFAQDPRVGSRYVLGSANITL